MCSLIETFTGNWVILESEPWLCSNLIMGYKDISTLLGYGKSSWSKGWGSWMAIVLFVYQGGVKKKKNFLRGGVSFWNNLSLKFTHNVNVNQQSTPRPRHTVCIIGHVMATSFRSISLSTVPLLHRTVLSHSLLNRISLGSFGQSQGWVILPWLFGLT